MFRAPNEHEKAIFNRLLSADFTGRSAIQSQLEHAEVRTIDEYGSIEIRTNGIPAAQVSQRIVTEGQALDIDKIPIYFLLHVVDGFVRELEIYRADGSKIQHIPDPSEINVPPIA